jgi:hypothetical protein
MKLPQFQQAEIAEAKLRLYLLNPDHREGKDKAAFFMRFGFNPEHWQVLETALRDHAAEHDVNEVKTMPTGLHYIVEGELKCPDGRTPLVCVVWRIDEGAEVPRLITAYPGG